MSNAEYQAAYYQRNKERKCAAGKRWREENKERYEAQQLAYRQANRERKRLATAEWRARNPGKQTAAIKEWQRKNRAQWIAAIRKWRIKNPLDLKLAMPKWANQFFISEIYDLAERRTKATGYAWHVDHIVPLRSKRVCGLHVEHNLRVIPAIRNLAKGNRHWPDMP